MAHTEVEIQQFLEELIDLVDSGENDSLVAKLNQIHPAKIAQLIESIAPKLRFKVWQKICAEKAGDTLRILNDKIQKQILKEMSVDELLATTEDFEIDDLADIIPNLSEKAQHYLLLSMDEKHKKHLKTVLNFAEDTAGGLMNTDVIAIRANITVDTALRYFRLLKNIPRDTDQIFVVDRNYRFVGAIYLTSLLSKVPEFKVADLLIKDENSAIDVEVHENAVANLFAQYDLISMAVVDKNGILVGRITVDDVVDVIREEAESSVKAIAGVNDEDVFDSVFHSFKNRSIWLGVNLITAFFAVFFIDLFADTIEQQVALAVLLPVVASMGGIAGSQTLTLVIRGVATQRVSGTHLGWLFKKEILMSILNGILWSSVIALITYLWFSQMLLSIIIGIAIIFNLIIASISGVLLPIIMKKIKIDPALAGGVVLTTITDVIGFVTFLGLASLLM
jgi:magnesium transporter